MKKRILSAFLLLALVLAMALPVSAAPVLDQTKLGSLTLRLFSSGEPVSGGTVSLYHIADIAVDDADLSFAYTEAFRDCPVALDKDLTSTDAAKAIEGYIADHTEALPALATQSVDANGTVTFQNLAVGLYLLTQKEAAPGYSAMGAFLISVPMATGDGYDYSVDATPKMGPIVPETTEPSQPTEPSKPTEPNLPQTGQLNWPVPVMAASGLAVFLLGWWMNASGKKKRHES